MLRPVRGAKRFCGVTISLMTVITIAAWQGQGNLDDVEANFAALDSAASRAAEHDAQILVTPEMILSGYNIPRSDLMAQSHIDFADRVAQVATRYGITILAGVPEFVHDGGSESRTACYNTSLLVSSTGEPLLQYRKHQLFGELDRGLFTAGPTPVGVTEHLGITIGTMICYDVEFAESVREARRREVDLLLVPTAQMEGYDIVNDAVIRTRAWDNGMYVAYVNRVGSESDLTYIGQSSICSPSGQRIAGMASSNTEDLLFAQIDTAEVEAARALNPYLEDLRTDWRS